MTSVRKSMRGLLELATIPFLFWVNLVWTKIKRPFNRKSQVIEVPSELLPLLQVGTLATRYSLFKGDESESLRLNAKLEDVIKGRADADTLLFVEKVLFGKDLFDTVYTWLVFLGDAHEDERELFRHYLTLIDKTNKKKA